MKKIINMLLVVALGFSLMGCSGSSEEDVLQKIKDEGVLKVGTSPDFPPNEYYAMVDGKSTIVGYEVSIAQAVADEIGVKLEVVATDFDTVKLNVASGDVAFGASGFARTPSREETYYFSDPYLQTASDGWQGIVVRTEDKDKYKSIEDIKKANLKIAAQSGSIQYELAMQLTDEANIVQLGTLDVCAMQLISKDVDAFVSTSDSASAIMETFSTITVLDKDNFNLDPEDVYGQNGIIFPKSDEYKSLVEVVNKVIKESTESGQMDKWYDEAVALQKDMIEE